jgi:type I restriction enzyme M protein
MTDLDQKQLGKTLWNIADTLRGAMNADDFRDYMLSFLFLRYLSDNYEAAAKKELRAIARWWISRKQSGKRPSNTISS